MDYKDFLELRASVAETLKRYDFNPNECASTNPDELLEEAKKRVYSEEGLRIVAQLEEKNSSGRSKQLTLLPDRAEPVASTQRSRSKGH